MDLTFWNGCVAVHADRGYYNLYVFSVGVENRNLGPSASFCDDFADSILWTGESRSVCMGAPYVEAL